ncbi:MAG: hypothetical protein M0Z37_01525 [Nitrospiraceae bacterium]|jgi:hypothetical protein|nr:hypothetical protein [Nitrospiraceae bacterium]
MERPAEKKIPGALLSSLIAVAIFFVLFGNSVKAGDLSDQAEEAKKSAEKSITNAAKKTGDYLKSNSFDQEVKRVFDGAGKAVQNAGDWLGGKIDSIRGKGTQK